MTGRYQKAKPYSVEAVLLYSVSMYMQKEELNLNPDKDAWMVMGIGARLAMKMGYHRDPRHLANVSPFEGEMRRRTFLIIEAFDLLLSAQAGLPAIIHEEECDTEPPSNLFDTDFDEDCNVLPPSRPQSDSTPILFSCHKSRIAKIFRHVVRHALSPKTPSYEEVMKLDGELHVTHADVPPSLRVKPLGLSFTDQAPLILNRLYIELLYLKSLCVLHRKYLSHDRLNPTFDYSRRTCTDAALRTLGYQAELHTALQPGGQFYNDKYMLSSLILHDFLLAAMIICLDLYESHNRSINTPPEDLTARVKQHDALRHSHGIWTSRSPFSRDARRASNILAAIFLKVPRPNVPPILMNGPHEMSNGMRAPLNGLDVIEPATHSPAKSSWNTAEVDVLHQETLQDNSAPEFDSADPLNTLFNDSDYIDWVSLKRSQ